MIQKTALITGATKGIGLAITQKLLASGYKVIGIARQNTKTAYPGLFYACDLSNEESTHQTLHDIKKHHTIDIIINNVGIAHPEPVGHIHLSTLKEVYDLNVRVAVQTTQTFLEDMQKNRWGRIINIVSRAAIRPVQNRSSYAAAKCALMGLIKTWGLELAKTGITVNAVAPGAVETELFRSTRPVGSEAEKQTLALIPMNRFGKPEDIAASIEFLISENANYITGQVLCIDGGASL